jgi:hypothetical protein
LSRVLGDEFLVLTAAVYFSLEAVEGDPQSRIARWVGGHDLGEFWLDEAVQSVAEMMLIDVI